MDAVSVSAATDGDKLKMQRRFSLSAEPVMIGRYQEEKIIRNINNYLRSLGKHGKFD